METTSLSPHQQAKNIMSRLDTPDYSVNFQPTYPNQDALLAAIAELLETTPATSIENVRSLRQKLAGYAVQADITGSCHETVRLSDPVLDIAELTSTALTERQIAADSGREALYIHRGAGQSVKPRSDEFEELASGLLIPSFMGHGVNDRDPDHRTPDPTRMVAMALQARDLTGGIQDQIGEHIPQAHEALLLAYEQAFIRIDDDTGQRYLLSADLPWIGMRTNNPDRVHVALLSTIENPVGVKIGSTSDSVHIQQLSERLNPMQQEGKLIFMLRIGDDVAKTREILDAIKIHAPTALIMYDIHGATRTNEQGQKIRCVQEVIRQIHLLQELCQLVGTTFNGLHLETTVEDRYECVDTPTEEPLHKGDVDPRLNKIQTKRVLQAV